MGESQTVVRVISGSDRDREWALDPARSYRMGRSGESDITLSDATVSGAHAALECTDGMWFLTDLQSRHGTYLNKQPIQGKRALFHGDHIRLGKTVLQFLEAEPPTDDDCGAV